MTGTGGVGKTRLAIELVERAARAFPDGVSVWVSTMAAGLRQTP